jgi:hypothetical protein
MKHGPITVAIGFDAASRRITVDGEPQGEPIVVLPRALGEGFDYQAEADRTNTIHWNPHHVHFDDFRRNVQAFVELAGVLNLYKKLLFRGRTPEELMMRRPEEGDSLAGYGGVIPSNEIDLVHGILGTMTETGEYAEILLDLLNGKQPDRINAIEETGDLRWYQNRVLRWADCDDLTCERMNVDKLHGRHGATFNTERDANRDLGAERSRLERGVEPGPLVDAAEGKKAAPKRRFMQQDDE